MKHVVKFNDYFNKIDEGRGISNPIKVFVDTIYNDIIQNLDINSDDEKELTYNFDKDGIRFETLVVYYKMSDKNYGLFNPNYSVLNDDVLNYVVIFL